MTTPQDFERLSAYLDNQLSPVEKAKFEARLAQEPELKAALTDLRMAVRALRALPTVKPSRNFTLSPAQVQARARPGPIFPALRLATALAALALVVVLVGDWGGSLLSGARGGAAAPAASTVSEQAAAVTEAPAVAAAAESASASETPLSAPEAGAAGGAEATAPTATETTGQAEAAATSAAQSADKLAETGTPMGNAALAPITPTGEEGTPALPPLPGDTVTPEASARTLLASTETPVAVANAGAASTEAVSVDTTAAAPGPSAPPLVRFLELGLAFLTVLLAAAAWLTRK